jgi:hypothetical protein
VEELGFSLGFYSKPGEVTLETQWQVLQKIVRKYELGEL